jgi:hypothetical protein
VMNLVFSRKNISEMRDIEIIFTVMCSLTYKVFIYMQVLNFLLILHTRKDSGCN